MIYECNPFQLQTFSILFTHGRRLKQELESIPKSYIRRSHIDITVYTFCSLKVDTVETHEIKFGFVQSRLFKKKTFILGLLFTQLRKCLSLVIFI